MTITYFGSDQNLVFVPALVALLVATVVICLPIVFAPTLRRSSRRVPTIALVVVVAVVALVGTGIFAGMGFRTLGTERADVQRQIQQTYGVDLDLGQVGELLDGGKPEKALPTEAAAAKLPEPEKPKTLKLEPTSAGTDTYELLLGGRSWPAS